jgi:hypothetical protein
MDMDEIVKARESLSMALTAYRAQYEEAQAALGEAQVRVESTRARYEALRSQIDGLLSTLDPNAPALTAAPQPKKPTVQPKRHIAPTVHGMTRIESIIHVMNGKAMTAGDIEDALTAANLAPKSNNLKGYISTLLSSHSRTAQYPDGRPILHPTTKKEIRVSTFTRVGRGLYQATVVNPEELLASLSADGSTEVVDAIEPPDVHISEGDVSLADDLFASQGLDVKTLNL